MAKISDKDFIGSGHMKACGESQARLRQSSGLNLSGRWTERGPPSPALRQECVSKQIAHDPFAGAGGSTWPRAVLEEGWGIGGTGIGQRKGLGRTTSRKEREAGRCVVRA